jgi:1L-myo-inositol 1-phosphate cytidylyltransferase
MSDSASPRTGVILAAGFGSRLAGTHDATDLKPLTPVAGTPLLIRTLNSLETAGCTRAVIVVGYGMDTVQAEIRDRYDGPLSLTFAVNEHYDRQNGVSVLAAEPYVDTGPFLLTMADHVLGDTLMEKARQHRPPERGVTLLVDYKLDTIFDMDDATKVRVESGRPRAIGKQLDDYNCVDTGVFVATDGLMEALSAVYAAKGDAALSDGIQRLMGEGRMQTLDIEHGFWQDVDTPEMLAHAEKMLATETVSAK